MDTPEVKQYQACIDTWQHKVKPVVMAQDGTRLVDHYNHELYMAVVKEKERRNKA